MDPWRGTLQRIFVAPARGVPMRTVGEVRAVPGRGLEGDRYFEGEGSFSRWPGPHREVTLIAEEDLDAMRRETGTHLAPSESRRNLLVRGVSLGHLIGHEFTIGTVHLRGIRLCEPCKYLVRLTGLLTLIPDLVHRGGLRARILSEGVLHVGDAIHPMQGAPKGVLGGAGDQRSGHR